MDMPPTETITGFLVIPHPQGTDYGLPCPHPACLHFLLTTCLRHHNPSFLYPSNDLFPFQDKVPSMPRIQPFHITPVLQLTAVSLVTEGPAPR